MKKAIISITAMSLFVSTFAFASDDFFKYSGKVTWLTDGIYRGLSQTEGQAQYIGRVDATHNNFYVAGQIKTIKDRTLGEDYQTAAIIGYRNKFNIVNYDFSAAFKNYHGAPVGYQNEYYEYQLDLNAPIAPIKGLKAKGTVSYVPDNAGKGKEAYYYEGGFNYKFAPKISGNAVYASRIAIQGVSYNAYMVGANYALSDTINLGLQYSDTDKHEKGDKYKDAFIFTASKKF